MRSTRVGLCVATAVLVAAPALSFPLPVGAIGIAGASSTQKRPARSKRTSKKTAGKAAVCKTCGGSRRTGKKTTKKAATRAKASPCHAKGYVSPAIAKRYSAALREMRRAGLRPRITSTWRSSERQAALHRCSNSRRCRRAHPGLYKALPPGRSLHEAGFAVDISGVASGPRGSKRLTSQGRKIVRIMRRHGFRWPYGLSDPAHFEADPTRYGYRNAQQAIERSQTRCAGLPVSSIQPRKPATRKAATAGKRAPGPATKAPKKTSPTVRRAAPGRAKPARSPSQPRKRGKNG